MVINSDFKPFLTMSLTWVQVKKLFLKVVNLFSTIFCLDTTARSLPTVKQVQARLTPCLE